MSKPSFIPGLMSPDPTQYRDLVKSGRDEWASGVGGVASVYEHFNTVAAGLGPGGLDRLNRVACDLMRDQGITFNIYHDERGAERILPFDLLPLPIDGEEWSDIDLGLGQRIRTWNMFVRDIYGQQEILKAGIVPYEIVFSDPQFHRECVGIKVPQDIFVHVAAADLVRQEKGNWVVVEDHLSNPTGASYALQNRRIVSQICPQLMEGVAITPIYSYPTQLLETLQASAPNTAGARVVLLSPGIYNEAYYDHSALARQMGIPLVQGNDLVVLNSELFLKTIGGLERVDVVYRRLDSAYIDPVTFRADSRLGVPGLLSCLRKGTVTIANALGTGLADNRAIAGYIPAMTEFYFAEKARLPQVPTYYLSDVDMRDHVFDNWRNFVVKTSCGRGPSSIFLCPHMTEKAWSDLRARIEKAPTAYIAQPYLHFSSAPTWIDGALRPRHVGVRAFTLNSPTGQSTPCALTRVALRANSLMISSAAGGGSKDTWILRAPRKRNSPPMMVALQPPRRMRLGSRTADSLFWIGRYAERAEATTRILRVLQQLRLEDSAGSNPKAWQPLWETLAAATGHPTGFFKKPAFQRERTGNLAEYILLDEDNFASTISCLRGCRQNAQLIREALPPEVWTIVNRLYLQLKLESEDKHSAKVKGHLADMTLQDELLMQLDELSGCVEKHMLHNDAWHFWQIGRCAERGLFTLLTMKQVFLKRTDERLGGAMTDDNNLDALLRMLAGQYAYRSSYKSRPVASQVAHLLLQDGEFPRSLVFSMEGLLSSLRRTFGERPAQEAEAPLIYCNHMLAEINFTDIDSYFSAFAGGTQSAPSTAAEARARTKRFVEWLDHLRQRVLALNNLINDHYLNHQAAAPKYMREAV